MRMYDVILKKRNGEALSTEEINAFIAGYTAGNIPDYQVSALLMAIYFQKMNARETYDLTLAMAHSGDMLDLSNISGVKCDKHSTGGVGDKTSLVLGPMVAAIGGKVAKMSGRGLGHTGGTIDKMESFTGLCTSLEETQFIKQVNDIGFAITGQTGNLAPADKKLYSLRDVTGTVDNISLIASSIMSKKIAAGADVIVLDVKCGSGAFMKREVDAFALGKAMVDIGNMAGKQTIAVVTEMDQPLGFAVGNALEVKEAIDTLKGKGPKDLQELCLTLGTYMAVKAGLYAEENAARSALETVIDNGKALDKLAGFVEAQHGDKNQVYHPETLPKAAYEYTVSLRELSGEASSVYVSHIQSDLIGTAVKVLGGGRATKEDVIDLSVGIVLHKKMGDFVTEEDCILTIYGNEQEKIQTALELVKSAYTFSRNPVATTPFVKGVIQE